MRGKNKTRVETAIDVLTSGDAPIGPGSLIPVQRLEEVFGFEHDTQEFNWLLHEIRKALHSHGLHLSGEGVSKTGVYSILERSENHWVAKLAMARAERDLEDKETLLVNTDTKGFTASQSMRHENTQRLISMRLNALRVVQEQNQQRAGKRKTVIEEALPESEE